MASSGSGSLPEPQSSGLSLMLRASDRMASARALAR
jgi:hypothetical protein